MRRDPSDVVVVDSAEPALIEAMHQRAIHAIPARKGPDSITAGVSKVQARLADPGDGRPRLTVDPSCTNLIAEFETYEWAKNLSGFKDKPKDENNHALDALRYYAQHLDQGPSFYLAGSNEHETKQATVPTFTLGRADPEWGW
jgi:phage terminase large subunit